MMLTMSKHINNIFKKINPGAIPNSLKLLLCFNCFFKLFWALNAYAIKNIGIGTLWNFTKHLHADIPEPYQVPAPEPSRTSPGTCTGTLRNLTRYLHQNLPEPHQVSAPKQASAPEPSGTPWNLARNLVLKLHRVAPELIWAKDPIAKFCCWGNMRMPRNLTDISYHIMTNHESTPSTPCILGELDMNLVRVALLNNTHLESSEFHAKGLICNLPSWSKCAGFEMTSLAWVGNSVPNPSNPKAPSERSQRKANDPHWENQVVAVWLRSNAEALPFEEMPETHANASRGQLRSVQNPSIIPLNWLVYRGSPVGLWWSPIYRVV